MQIFPKSLLVLVVVACSMSSTSAFAPNPPRHHGSVSSFAPPQQQDLYQPASLQRQRCSVAQVQTMGLFGLGAPEIGVILVAAAFLLGPDKLAELGKDAGKIAGELKEVPKEFQKGIEEGEAQANATRAKIAAEDEKESGNATN